MPMPFKLTAIPSLSPGGEFKRSLEGVTFIATAENESHSWWSANMGRLVNELEQVVPPEVAIHILLKLEDGETVEFRNRYELSDGSTIEISLEDLLAFRGEMLNPNEESNPPKWN